MIDLDADPNNLNGDLVPQPQSSCFYKHTYSNCLIFTCHILKAKEIEEEVQKRKKAEEEKQSLEKRLAALQQELEANQSRLEEAESSAAAGQQGSLATIEALQTENLELRQQMASLVAATDTVEALQVKLAYK